MNYQSLITTQPNTVSWSGSPDIKPLTFVFTPSAAMAALWDVYRVTNIHIRLLFTPSGSTYKGDVSYGHPHAICYDPSNIVSGVPTTLLAVLSYRNSEIFALTNVKPQIDYNVKNPTRYAYSSSSSAGGADLLLTDPISTDSSWNAGALYISPWTAYTTEVVGYVVEYTVQYSQPRAEH